jgi:hypothetical protein
MVLSLSDIIIHHHHHNDQIDPINVAVIIAVVCGWGRACVVTRHDSVDEDVTRT